MKYENHATPDDLKKHWIPLYDEIYRRVDRRMRKTPVPPLPGRAGGDNLSQFKNILLAKLGTTYSVLDSEIDKIIKTLKVLSKMHAFYKELFTMRTGRTPEDLLGRYRGKRRVLGKIYRETRMHIKSGLTGGEAKRSFRNGIGRMLSLLKRDHKLLEIIKETVKEISKMPDITGDLTVIVAGMPQVGKSTLLRALTNAEPEIRPYPFTTKTIIAGHIIVKPYGRITLIDTPGLLDRPIDEKNDIEMKAVLALKHLSDILLYMFDVNPNTYYGLDEQINVYRDILRLMTARKTIIVINKTDITPHELLEKALRTIEEETGLTPLPISAQTGQGLDKLLGILENLLIEKIQSHQH